MNVFRLILLLHSITVVVSHKHSVHNRKTKRVVGGEELPVRDPSFMPYRVVEYFVYIGNGKTCKESPSVWDNTVGVVLSQWCAPGIYSVKCGGALVTPQVVQTACHCLADFDAAEKPANQWVSAHTRSSWEYHYEIYMGVSDIANMKFNLFGFEFLIHPRCAERFRFPYHISYDYGWIYLDFPVPGSFMDYRSYFMDYAPLYTMAKLEAMYEEYTKKETVCLVVGFGKVDESANKVGSPILKHTWIQIMDYVKCEYLRSTYWNLKDPYNYTERASWVCAEPLPFKKSIQGYNHKGDSGSPITCNNNYFAVVSGHTNKTANAGVPLLMFEDPIKFAHWENAYEFREEFIKYIADHADKKVIIDNEDLRVIYPRGGSGYRKNYIRKTIKNRFKLPQLSATSFAVSTTSSPFWLILICGVNYVFSILDEVRQR